MLGTDMEPPPPPPPPPPLDMAQAVIGMLVGPRRLLQWKRDAWVSSLFRRRNLSVSTDASNHLAV